MSAFIYVIEDSSRRVKIGRSIAPRARRSHLQHANAERLTIYHQREVPAADVARIESAVHGLVAPWKLRGEWFGCEQTLARAAVDMVVDRDPDTAAFVKLIWQMHAADLSNSDQFHPLCVRLVAEHPILADRALPYLARARIVAGLAA
jgi:hypothetical protein